MKYIIIAAALFPMLLIAQSPQPIRRPMVPQQSGNYIAPADPFPDNYQVTLTITDKEVQPVEISVVVASSQFTTSFGEQSLTFSGSITIEDSGGIILAYALGWDTPITTNGSTQYKTSATQGSVRLKPGEDIQIIRAGTRTARLSVKKLDSAK